jgi:hypothetical protein
VRCLRGPAVWQALDEGLWSRRLLDALTPARRIGRPTVREEVEARPNDALFLIEHGDGLRSVVGMFDSLAPCFAYAGLRRGIPEPDAAVFFLQEPEPFPHFGYLVRAIEHLVIQGKEPYPLERTLLTTGILAAAMQSLIEQGRTIATPHLSRIRYEATDWAHAAGPVGTPA